MKICDFVGHRHAGECDPIGYRVCARCDDGETFSMREKVGGRVSDCIWYIRDKWEDLIAWLRCPGCGKRFGEHSEKCRDSDWWMPF